MKDLWRKTTELFWEYPILWLPVICADLAEFFLRWLQKAASRKIVNAVMTQHSVLGGNFPNGALDPGVIHKAVLLTAPLLWGTYFVSIALFSAAFVVTSASVCGARQHQKPDMMAALWSLKGNFRGVLAFSLKFLGLYALVAFLTSLLPIDFFKALFQLPHVTPLLFGSSLALVFSVSIAWLMTPVAMRLLQGTDTPDDNADRTKLGRVCAMATAAAVMTFSYCVESAIHTMSFTSSKEFTIVNLVGSLIVSSPYLLLFIALSLLMMNKPKDAADEAALETGNPPEN